MKTRLSVLLMILLLAGCGQTATPMTTAPPPAPTPSPTATAMPAPTAAPEITWRWPGTVWETSTPEAEGISSADLAGLFAAIERLRLNVHSVVVVRHGAIVTEAYYYPNRPEIPHDLASVTKSFTGTLIGIAHARGDLPDLDAPVVDFFPDLPPADPATAAITIRHLLTMSAGWEWNESAPYSASANDWYGMMNSGDWIRYVLDRPVSNTPGATFTYNSGASNLLLAILQRATGESPLTYAEEHLFQPISIDPGPWIADQTHNLPLGGGGLYLTTRDMARLGVLYARQGAWNGEQIVPADWVAEASAPHFDAGANDMDYGFQWWVDSDGRYLAALGHGGQVLLVAPEHDLVLAANSGVSGQEIQSLISLFEYGLLPMIEDGPLPADAEGTAALAAAIDEVESEPPAEVRDVPATAREISGRVYVMDPNEWSYETVRLDFGNAPKEAATLSITWPGEDIFVTIGLDGRFAFSEFGGQIHALRGYWRDEFNFNVEHQTLGEADLATTRFTFEDDRLTMRLRLAIESNSSVLTGTAAP